MQLAEAVLSQINVAELIENKIIFEQPILFFKMNEGKTYKNETAQEFLSKSPVTVKGFGLNGTSIA